MFIPLLDKFPALQKVKTEEWDFVLTVASVFMAATSLNNLRLDSDREEKLMVVVAEQLNQWNPDGIYAFEDCKTLFEKEFDHLTESGHESRFVASDAIGICI